MKKRIVSLILCLALLLCAASVIALPTFAATSGKTGDCTWSLDGTALTITGNGKMANYQYDSTLPWGTSITSVTIGDGVTSIGEYAFYNCSSLASITIPDSVTSIEYKAFNGCSKLTSVTIGNGVTSIGSYAFSGCSSLASITIPDSVTSIGSHAFSGCSSLASITIPDSVASIENHAFYNCSSLASIDIPDSVTSIGKYAFYGCSKLSSITIPDSVTSIGDDAFFDTAYYNNDANWQDDVLYIGNHLIRAKNTISGAYTVKAGTKTIAGEAFAGCKSLTSIDIPDSVQYIGKQAFGYYSGGSTYGSLCINLTEIKLPGKLKSIEEYTFDRCSSLKSITIPDSVTSIGEYAFRGCSSLTSINIPEKITTIQAETFADCISLKDIDIPDSVTRIENYAFAGCESFTSIDIPDSVQYIGRQAFGHCSYIGSHYCINLTEIKLPGKLKNIEDSTFYGCSALKSINIPKSVTNIGKEAFYGCSALTDVYYGGREAEWKKVVIFDGNTYLNYATVHFGAKAEKDPAKVFADIKKSNWYYEAVSYAYNAGLFGGISATKFAPNDNMTRAMFVTVLGRLYGVKVNNNITTKFVDVKKGQWYTGYVKWASDAGIVSGISATEFAPNANVTREQICKMMVEYCKYAKIALKSGKAITFADANKISAWAKTYVSKCQTAGLVGGSIRGGKTYFDPQGKATRAQVAQILYNFSKNYLK